MPNNRARGRRGELEIAELLGGQRISRTGEAGSDIVDRAGRTWEVKRLRELPALLRSWLQQMAAQGDHGVAFRADRSQWYLLIPLRNYVHTDREGVQAVEPIAEAEIRRRSGESL